MYGSYSMTAGEVLKTLLGKGDGMQRIAVFDLRLPRAVTAVLVGAALAVSGCILQSITKNELAEPGIIGINAGAALAVVLLISVQSASYYTALGLGTVLLMPLAAAAGAFASFLCIYALAGEKGRLKPARLILAGIGVNTGITALITLYQLNMSKGDYNQALSWIGGSLWGSSWTYAAITAPVITVLIGIVFYKNRTLDVMDLGDELAAGLGVRVNRERKIFLVLAVCLAACATSVAGNIAFAGLIGPHLQTSCRTCTQAADTGCRLSERYFSARRGYTRTKPVLASGNTRRHYDLADRDTLFPVFADKRKVRIQNERENNPASGYHRFV